MTHPDIGPSPLQWLLLEVERSPDFGPRGRARLELLLSRMVGSRIYVTKRDIRRPEWSRVARAMLDGGSTYAEAWQALALRCGLKRNTAQRIVSAALSQRALEAISARQMSLDLPHVTGADNA